MGRERGDSELTEDTALINSRELTVSRDGKKTIGERIFSPGRLLIFFCFIQFFTYFDRGAIASVLDEIQGDAPMNGLKYNLTNSTGGTSGKLTQYTARNCSQPVVPHKCKDGKDTCAEKDLVTIKCIDGTELGVVTSAFIGGFMVFCPIFAMLARWIKPTTLVAVGIFGWCIAAFLCGMARNLGLLLFARAMVGVGEASFVGLAPTLLDNVVPPARRTLWLGLFYATIPLGQASGIGAAGVIAATVNAWSPTFMPGWRLVFFGECLINLPCVFLCLIIPAKYNEVREQVEEVVPLKGVGLEEGLISDDGVKEIYNEESDPNKTPTLLFAIKYLFCNKSWMLGSIGYGAYTFVIGAISAWAPFFIAKKVCPPANLDPTIGKAIFGAITAITGLAGGLLGGILVDMMPGGSQGTRGSANVAWFNTMSVLIAIPLGALSFLFISPVPVFFTFLTFSTLALFANQGPINVLLLSVVQSNMRAYAMAINVLLIHLMGDFPSPIVIGFLNENITHNVRWSLFFVWWMMIIAFLLWGAGWRVLKSKYLREEGSAGKAIN